MDFAKTFPAVINSVLSVDATMFSEEGMLLAGALAVIAIILAAFKVMLEGEAANAAIGHIVKVALVLGFAVAVIGGNGYASAGAQFSAGFDKLATKALKKTGASCTGANTGEMVGCTVNKFVQQALQLWLGIDSAAPTGSVIAQLWIALTTSVQDAGLSMLLKGLVVFLFKLLMSLAVIAAGTIYCAQLVIFQALANISLVVMPLMVPWILLDVSNFVFNSWLRFTIVAGVAKLVGAILFGMTSGAIDKGVEFATQANAGGDFGKMFVGYSFSLIVICIVAFLMSQTMAIANGLVSGAAHVGWMPRGKLPSLKRTSAGEK